MDIVDRLKCFAIPSEPLRFRLWEAIDEIERLRAAIRKTLDENGHLADGDNCTLAELKKVIE